MFEELEALVAAAAPRPTVNAGLKRATLSGLEQLGAQEVVDGHGPRILVGCVMEVSAWPCIGVRDNSLVVVADTEVGGRQSAQSKSSAFRGWALQTEVDWAR